MRMFPCSLNRKVSGVSFILVNSRKDILMHKINDVYHFPCKRIEIDEDPFIEVIKYIAIVTGLKDRSFFSIDEVFDFSYKQKGQILYNRFYFCVIVAIGMELTKQSWYSLKQICSLPIEDEDIIAHTLRNYQLFGILNH